MASAEIDLVAQPGAILGEGPVWLVIGVEQRLPLHPDRLLPNR
jgi:hypothetical protein